MQAFDAIPDLPSTANKPFCHAVKAEGSFLFLSGQGPWDPGTESFSRGTIAEQTQLTLACLGRVLAAAGARPGDVASVKVYLQPLTRETWYEMNGEFVKFFGTHKPARTAIGCSLLGLDVEMDAVALLPGRVQTAG